MSVVDTWDGKPAFYVPLPGMEMGQLPGFDPETLTAYYKVWELTPVNFQCDDWIHFINRPLIFHDGDLPFEEQRAACYAPRFTTSSTGTVFFDVSVPVTKSRTMRASDLPEPGMFNITTGVLKHYREAGYFMHAPADLPRHQRLSVKDWRALVKSQCPSIEEAYELLGTDKGNGLDRLEQRWGLNLPLKGVVILKNNGGIRSIIKGA